MRVTVVHAPIARSVQAFELRLPTGATVADALVAFAASNGQDLQDLTFSIWGRTVESNVALKDGDRLELCRPLRVDPKRARRERFRRQGARSAGLFAQRRPGGKPGY
jgi:putative ubiquitin-RnfH superfamily antitoxin RatB of RatAB toxin-antitoxin module